MGKKLRRRQIFDVVYSRMMRLFLISLCFCAIFCAVFQLAGTVYIARETLETEAQTAAARVSWAVKSYKNIAEDLGSMPELSSEKLHTNFKELILQAKCREYDLMQSKTIRTDGYSDMDDEYRGHREYFKHAMQGEIVISDPLVSKSDGETMVVVAAPLWRAGVFQGTVDGVVFCGLDEAFLDQIIENLAVSKNSCAYIITRDGTTVTSSANEKNIRIFGKTNIIKLARSDRKFKIDAKAETKILFGKYGANFLRNGLSIICYASAPIAETPGWSMIIKTPLTDFLGTMYVFLIFIATVIAVSLMIVSRQSKKIAVELSRPIKNMSKRLERAAAGDFTSDVQDESGIEEIGMISRATQSLVNRMDVVLNGGDRYKDVVLLEELLGKNALDEICKNYYDFLDVNICVKNLSQKIIAGRQPEKTLFSTVEKIFVRSRELGTVTVSAVSEKCLLSDEEIVSFTKGFLRFVNGATEMALQKNSEYIRWRENEQFNVQNLILMSERLSESVQLWIEAAEKAESSRFVTQEALKFARVALFEISEISDYVRFTELNPRFNEDDYSLKEFSQNLTELFENSEECFATKIFFQKDMAQNFFGDQMAIAKIIHRIVLNLNQQNSETTKKIEFDASEKNYQTILKVKIFCDGEKLNEEQVLRLNTLIDDESCDKKATAFEYRIMGAFRLAKKMNGKVFAQFLEKDFSQDSQDLQDQQSNNSQQNKEKIAIITILIPQLTANAEKST